MELADETGKIRVSLWNEKAQKPLNIGDAIRIENARIRFGLYSVELSAGRTTRITEPLPEDIQGFTILLRSLKKCSTQQRR